MQHGLLDTGSVMTGIGAIALAGKPAVVRIALGDDATASRALDMGAEAVIAPMVNSVEDARALAAATKYPPVGERSWGPTRAMTLARHRAAAQYLENANRTCFTFAMIETVRALDALDAILAVDGIDGVFVGPFDLSVSLSAGRQVGTGRRLGRRRDQAHRRARRGGGQGRRHLCGDAGAGAQLPRFRLPVHRARRRSDLPDLGAAEMLRMAREP